MIIKQKHIVLWLLFALCLGLTACGGDDGLVSTDKSSLVTDTIEIDSNYEYQLPVIFHVLYKNQSDASQYIPAARLKNLLQYVNEIYQGGIYGESENLHLKFVLAEKDEKGKKLGTPGVEYVKYDGDYPIDVNAFMSDNTGANVKYIWDPNQYINVMMFNFKSSSSNEITLGISHMPHTVDNRVEGLDNVNTQYIAKSKLPYPLCSSINSTYAAQASNGSYFESDRYTDDNHVAHTLSTADVVVTMAHELGHYLGLYHAFTEKEKDGSYQPVDSCGDTDYCKDTPSYNRIEYNNYLETLTINGSDPNMTRKMLSRSSCDGKTFESDNIMDYSLTMGFQITADQKKRIRNVLYYSPLIPGPKKNNINTRTRATDDSHPLDLRFTIIK
jgi:zinc-dependent metalloproteinase lipoprotein